MGRARYMAAVGLLVAALVGCVPASCPWSGGEALLTPSWAMYRGCRG